MKSWIRQDRGWSQRGSSLVATLMLLTLLLLVGMGVLGSSVQKRRAQADQVLLAQARQLARAGFEEAMLKLNKDIDFPPAGGDDQTEFRYSEEVADFDGTVLGRYDILIDTCRELPPYQVIRIVSVGSVESGGTWSNLPRSRFTLSAVLDVSPTVRGTTNPNPNYWRLIRFDEMAE